MATDFTIRLDQRASKKALDTLKNHPAKINEITKNFLFVSANFVRNKAIRNAPYKTGNLRRSLTTSFTVASRGREAMIGSNLVYARIHEFGGLAGRGHRSKIPPFRNKGYLRPALKALQGAKAQMFFSREFTKTMLK